MSLTGPGKEGREVTRYFIRVRTEDGTVMWFPVSSLVIEHLSEALENAFNHWQEIQQ